MSRSVPWLLLGSAVVAALIALAGCSHYLSGEREAWRGEAEAACLNSGAVKESAERVRISAIEGPGICGADYPLRVSALGESAPLGYDDEPLRPPGAIPDAALPPRWPVAQSNALPPPVTAHPAAIQPRAIRSTAFRTCTERSATKLSPPVFTTGRRTDVALPSRRCAT